MIWYFVFIGGLILIAIAMYLYDHRITDTHSFKRHLQRRKNRKGRRTHRD